MSRERDGRPGVSWETAVMWTEVVAEGDDGSPFGWSEDAGPDFDELMPPRPNRAARRAARRGRAPEATGSPQGPPGREAPEVQPALSRASGNDSATEKRHP